MPNRSQFPIYDPNNPQHNPLVRDGIKYVYNQTSEWWETAVGENINIVTKDTDAIYRVNSSKTQSVSHKGDSALLTVAEVDNNFIQLKQSILNLEEQANFYNDFFNDQVTGLASDILAGDTAVNLTLNNAQTGLSSKMPISGGTFSGAIRGPHPAANGTTNELVTTTYVTREFQQINTNVTPFSSNVRDLGEPNKLWRAAYFGDKVEVGASIEPGSWVPVDTSLDELRLDPTTGQNTLIQYKNVNIGSATNRFNKIFVRDIEGAGATLTLGTATISQTTAGGVLLPTNSSVGTEENEIPTNFASTLIDERFARFLTSGDNIASNFTASGAISINDPVKIDIEGTVTRITGTNGSEGFIGFANTPSFAAGSTVQVTVSGVLNNFTGLTESGTVFLDSNGTITQTKSDTTIKIGFAISETSFFLFAQNPAASYVIGKDKLSKNDLSVSQGIANGDGSLSYNNQTGNFTFIPPDLSPFATQIYVDNQINSLISGAPDALNTLDELASALDDNANFAATITNTIGLKSPIASPTFTGSPRAPTPANDSNSTEIATTAWVRSQGGAADLAALSDVTLNTASLADGQVLAYDAVSGVFKNRVGGTGTGGSNVTFIVDGGTSTTAASSIDIFLDGGGA